VHDRNKILKIPPTRLNSCSVTDSTQTSPIQKSRNQAADSKLSVPHLATQPRVAPKLFHASFHSPDASHRLNASSTMSTFKGIVPGKIHASSTYTDDAADRSCRVPRNQKYVVLQRRILSFSTSPRISAT
jgi:hypothetical protein